MNPEGEEEQPQLAPGRGPSRGAIGGGRVSRSTSRVVYNSNVSSVAGGGVNEGASTSRGKFPPFIYRDQNYLKF